MKGQRIMKYSVKRNENGHGSLVTKLEFELTVDDLTFAVVCQRFLVESTAIGKEIILGWAVDNIRNGRLYKSRENEPAIKKHMPQAKRLVHDFFPELFPSEKGEGLSKSKAKI